MRPLIWYEVWAHADGEARRVVGGTARSALEGASTVRLLAESYISEVAIVRVEAPPGECPRAQPVRRWRRAGDGWELVRRVRGEG